MCGQHDSRSGRAAAAAATAAAAACQPVDCVAHSLVAVHCCRQGQDATALRDLQHWAEAERCAEAQRLLAKAHLQVAMNRQHLPPLAGPAGRASGWQPPSLAVLL